MEFDDYFASVVLEATKHIKCGLDLEFVSRGDLDWFELGVHRVDYEIVDLDELSDYVISLKTSIMSLPSTTENFRLVSTFSKWLVVPAAINDDGSFFDFVVASESLLSGEIGFDGRALGAMLDAIVGARIELAS